MPELPEVETVMRGLQARLEGRVLLRAVARRPDLRWPLPPGLAATLTGARVTGFRRRAKYILMRLDSGWSVLLHLGMSGRMLVEPVGRNDITLHEHLEMETDDGWRVGFVDPRRFGSVDLIETDREDQHRRLAGLGPEPLDDAFSVAVLTAALEGKKTPIKAALLDQKIVAGLGNIYVCEALFRAGISPQRSGANGSGGDGPGGWCRQSSRHSPKRSPPAVRRCATTSRPTANWAISSTPGKSTGARESPAPSAQVRAPARVCAGSRNRAAARSTAPGRSDEPYPKLGIARETESRGPPLRSVSRAFLPQAQRSAPYLNGPSWSMTGPGFSSARGRWVIRIRRRV